MKILVMSCDKNTDLFPLFKHCIEKYWPNHPEIIYSTETVKNPFYKTVCKNYSLGSWTKRVYESVKEIIDDFILLMCDDIFIREKVDDNFIESLTKYFDENTAAINFENHFDKKDLNLNDILKIRCDGKYKTSMMFQLWKRDKLLSVLDGIETDPWNFEQLNPHKNYRYLVNANPHKGLINFGKVDRIYNWGIVQGQWTSECLKFFRDEGFVIDGTVRGCIDIKPCFGIPSLLPSKEPDRAQRKERLERLLNQLYSLWPDIPVILVAQLYGDYSPKVQNKLFRYDYGKLGILGARHTLRKHFLESEYDYLIMFDDDAIIQLDTPSAARDYLNELYINPNGFCFIKGGNGPYCPYADSQLNLCAISKYIYTSEPIPNIDPQKSEGFEDRIWSTLLHFKYADKEFDAPATIRCNHFKNESEPVPSTWAGEASFKWRQMRQNTLEIEKYIVENKSLPPIKTSISSGGIDLVVPYVDSSDNNWQELFNKYNPHKNEEGVDAVNRFRGQGDLFRFFFRGVEKNLPWINKIHLLVQSESQVPEWINRDVVHVVLHEQFIPEEFLPTFNSTTIEMFLWNIPGLSERFIYANDDEYILNPMSKDMFFRDGKTLNYVYDVTRMNTVYGHHVDNSFKLIYGNLKSSTVTVYHTLRPYVKSLMRECYFKYEKEIRESITKFRDIRNINIYVFDFYNLKEGRAISEKPFNTTTVGTHSGVERISSILNKKTIHTICIQDTSTEQSIYADEELINCFKSIYKNKSRFENPEVYSGLTEDKLEKIERLVSRVPESKREGFRKVLIKSWSL